MKYESLKRTAGALWVLAAFSMPVFAGTSQFPAQGVWRGEFQINGDPLPFNFEIKGSSAEDATFTLLNGTRRDDFRVEQIAADTIWVKMNTYDAAVEAKIEEGSGGKRLVGYYKDLVPSRKGARDLPFVAEHGKAHRFVEPGQDLAPEADLTGKWAVEQLDKSARADKENQVALLKQDGNRLTGVFMTVVGDTRELEGTVQGNRFYLSHFSGPSPRLIKGTIDEDGNIQGAFGSGLYNVVKFEGIKADEVELPDPYQLTYLKDGQKTIDFTFPGLDGHPVSLQDEKYQGKVVLVEIIGTWCPNCTDQTQFLAPWFRENQHRGVEAIAVAFEQEDSFEYFQRTLSKLKEHYGITYDIAFGGLADKRLATDKFQGLNYMAAFPTTILIDRSGEVREIYTGYTGTITGEYFRAYVEKFNALMDGLLAEPNPYAKELVTSVAR